MHGSIKVMKNTTKTRDSRVITLTIGSIIFAWLTLLTVYAIDGRNQQLQQAKADSEAIYKLMVDNGIQQEQIDELRK